jgi:hypothetical protein
MNRLGVEPQGTRLVSSVDPWNYQSGSWSMTAGVGRRANYGLRYQLLVIRFLYSVWNVQPVRPMRNYRN